MEEEQPDQPKDAEPSKERRVAFEERSFAERAPQEPNKKPWRRAKKPVSSNRSEDLFSKPSPSFDAYESPRDFGYVFVLLANLKEINCDSWLGASGASLDPRYLADFPEGAAEVSVPIPQHYPHDTHALGKMYTFHPWPSDRPKPYSVHLSTRHHGQTLNYINEIDRFIRIAAADCYSRWPDDKVRKNVCPLLATSLLGTGYGGNYRRTGQMVKELLPRLYALADEYKVDIAIVTIEEEVYALTNSVKKQFFDTLSPESPLRLTISGGRYFQEQALTKLSFLVSQAVRGELTLFVGAGASMGVGIPSWNSLLSRIAARLGLSGDDLAEFETMDYYAKAAVLESRVKKKRSGKVSADASRRESLADGSECPESTKKEINTQKETPGGQQKGFLTGLSSYYEALDEFARGRPAPAATASCEAKPDEPCVNLGHYVAMETKSRYYSLVDAILSSLPCKEIITTNYDDLLEKAWRYSGPFSVLPYFPRRGCKRWLLKMHGTITHPDEIVLSKRDYMRYQDRFAAMAGILQSTLLTRHLLFVGFSLDDDNFQRIFDSVRKARSPGSDDDRPPVKDDDPFSVFYTQKKMRDKAIKRYGLSLNFPVHEFEIEEDAGAPTSNGMDACGTAIMLEHSNLKAELWEGDIDLTFLQERSEKSRSAQHGVSELHRLARLQEIFLDILSSRCSQCGHIKFIMNDRYVDALTPGEIEFRDCIKEFQRNLNRLSDESKTSRPYQYFLKSLRKMGL